MAASIGALKANLKDLFKKVKSFEDAKFEEIIQQSELITKQLALVHSQAKELEEYEIPPALLE